MPRLLILALLAALALPTLPAALSAQASCGTPDTIVVRGTVRTTPGRVVTLSGLVPGRNIPDYLGFQNALRAVFASGEYDNVEIACELFGDTLAATVIDVVERPTLAHIEVAGNRELTRRAIDDRIDLLSGRVADPALITRAITRIDSLYQSRGFYLAQITTDTAFVEPGRIGLTFRVDEGRRLAIAGLEVIGADRVTAEDVAKAMDTRPEGFFWFRSGGYSDEKYQADLGENLPQLYAERGFLDFRLEQDTLIVDRELGKGFIRLTVNEGPQFRVGSFTAQGNQHFTDEQIRRFYPFGDDAAGPSLTQRLFDAARRRERDPDAFDMTRWDEATSNLYIAYQNEGYARVNLVPVIERSLGPDSLPVVNLQWRIQEGAPSIVNRVDVIGNNYTVERCIRDMIVVLPGDVFSRDRLIRSIQSISNMGFFEPLGPTDVMTPPANEEGDINVIIRVKEKRTGNIQFGASMGQGTGIGGFIGLDQPNLFGRCKRVSLNWQFGRYLNDFNLSYSDPAIRLSRISGSVSLYRSQARYRIADLGQTTRTGGSLRFGFPVRGSVWTRAFVSYTGEAVNYGEQGLLGTVSDCTNCIRSSLGLDLTRDTRFGLPFPVGGALSTIGAQFNGGVLGGSAAFQRYTGESRAYVPLMQFGGSQTGAPMDLALGLTTRAGAVFGNTGPFFFSQRFALGGVQFGESLRGYPEFSITPQGFLTGTGTYNAQRESFGSAFFASTLELGLRFNPQVYTSVFVDAGNVWETPREFDPTRLYRGAGFGVSVVTPLGPLGLDWAYGFDRLNEAGRPDPKWQLHFRLGQLF